jgi:hypothetical protein
MIIETFYYLMLITNSIYFGQFFHKFLSVRKQMKKHVYKSNVFKEVDKRTKKDCFILAFIFLLNLIILIILRNETNN